MRALSVITGIGCLVLVAGCVIAGAIASWSPWGWLMLLSVAVAAVGLLLVHGRWARPTLAVAAALLLTLFALRVVAAASGQATMVTLPGGTSSRWTGRIIDEQDLSLAGAQLLRLRWRLPRDEQQRLVPAMRDAYVEMRRDLGPTPSPSLATLFSRQRSSAFDTFVIEPRDVPRPRAGVVFLHGYGGSFTLECWLVARAAGTIGAVTVCPATDFSGHWGSRDGERTFGETLHYLKARGIEHVYLAGLSNGGVGASALTARFSSSLSGLIIISGAPSSGGNGGLPTLVVQGERDTMASAATARAFAARTHATYAGFDGGHFVLLIRRDEVRNAIASWLRRHEQTQ